MAKEELRPFTKEMLEFIVGNTSSYDDTCRRLAAQVLAAEAKISKIPETRWEGQVLKEMTSDSDSRYIVGNSDDFDWLHEYEHHMVRLVVYDFGLMDKSSVCQSCHMENGKHRFGCAIGGKQQITLPVKKI